MRNTLDGSSSGRTDNYEELRQNNIFVFDEFLSSSVCNNLLFDTEVQHWRPSSVAKIDSQGEYRQFISRTRTNEIYHYKNFAASLRAEIAQIEEKISNLIGIDTDRLEDWQISKYNLGQKFDFHNDCGCWSKDLEGEREKTILLYLLAPISGGETFFRALNLAIRPIQGRLVVWDNLLPNGDCNFGMIHGGFPIKQGVKIVLTTWMRQRAIRAKKS